MKHSIDVKIWARERRGQLFENTDERATSVTVTYGDELPIEGEVMDFGDALDIKLLEAAYTQSFRSYCISRTYSSKTEVGVEIWGKQHHLVFNIGDFKVCLETE